MSAFAQRSEQLSAKQLLGRVGSVDGPGSSLDADIVTAPIPRTGSSFGGYPAASSAVAVPIPFPGAIYARFPFGV